GRRPDCRARHCSFSSIRCSSFQRFAPAAGSRYLPPVSNPSGADMSFLQDLRFAIRLLIKDRWFTLVAVTALALGIGVNATVFTLIGQRPVLGRDFLPEDDKPGAPPVAILGGGIWKSRYGSDPAILGRIIKINEVPTTVIGVMPEGMKFPFNADLWLPLSSMP